MRVHATYDTSGMDEVPPIVTKAYDLACWLLPRVNDFPRSYRFVLGGFSSPS